MNEENIKPSQNEQQPGIPSQQGQQFGPAEMAECCESMMAQMAAACPCGSFIKKHWLAAGVMFLVMILMLLISQVGGIIAFIRTL